MVMKQEKTRNKLFTRRSALLMGGQFALMCGLAGRMYYLQVVESERYKVLAEENRVNFRLLPPPRGFIVDRNGDYLAINIQNYRVILVPEQANNGSSVGDTLGRLQKIIDIDDRDIQRVLREVRKHRAFVPITIRENLSWEEVSRISVNTPELPGINIDVGQTRHYPYGPNMAHVIGYVAAVSDKDMTGDPLLELPGFKIGKNGIEREYDEALRGRAGTSQVEVNAVGRVIRELSRQEGQPGREVRLTLDMRLQDFIGERVKDEHAAAVVVMDCQNGDVLGLVSTPSYDPNAFSEGLNTEQWQSLVTNPYNPLTNKAIAGQYAPGSTFKIVVALAALEHGISPDHTVFCPGYLEFGDRRFHCWKHYGHGNLNMTGALRESCDVWFYDVARRIGVNRIAAMAKRLGMGGVTDIDLLGEKSGLIPTKEWKMATKGQPWHQGETLVVGIGQGYVLSTPLQLAVMLSRTVNGGKAIVPRLTVHDIDGSVIRERTDAKIPGLNIDPDHIKIVKQGLDEVVNSAHGTAHRAALGIENFAMGGKTGTAQVRRISMAERESGVRKGEDIAWRLRDHALFVGFAPVDNPRYVTAVVVEHGGSGSGAAAPIARDIMREAYRLFGRQGERIAHPDLDPDEKGQSA